MIQKTTIGLLDILSFFWVANLPSSFLFIFLFLALLSHSTYPSLAFYKLLQDLIWFFFVSWNKVFFFLLYFFGLNVGLKFEEIRQTTFFFRYVFFHYYFCLLSILLLLLLFFIVYIYIYIQYISIFLFQLVFIFTCFYFYFFQSFSGF